MKEKEKVIKHFPLNEKIEALLFVLTAANKSFIFDLSSDAKARKAQDSFTNEYCTIRYNKMHEVINDAQFTFKIYTGENLMKFFANEDVINFILNSEKYNNIKVLFSKKFIATLESKAWKQIEYIPVKDEAAEERAKLERQYNEFIMSGTIYKFRKYNPNQKYIMDYNGMVVYDSKNPKDINNVYEFPLSVNGDMAHYIKMCKVYWCKENKFDISEKLADARIMETKKYRETILNL